MNDTSATQQVPSTATPLLAAAEAAAALGAFLRLTRDDTTVGPRLSARLDAVLDGLGVRDAVQLLDAHETEALLGIIEGFLAQATDFVARPDTMTPTAGFMRTVTSSWHKATRARW